MDYLHIHVPVRSIHQRADASEILNDTIRLASSTPRAEAIFLFITDILWLSKRFLSVPCESSILNIPISNGLLVFVGIPSVFLILQLNSTVTLLVPHNVMLLET